MTFFDKDNLRLMREHFDRVADISRPSRYGLICYTYNDGLPEEGYYAPSVMNIGDYIQSLAARQFLPLADTYVDRDQLGKYDGGPVNMIMNAWHRLWRKNLTFAPAINPLMVAVHLSNPEAATEETVSYFKRHEPIGCRDFHTLAFLKGRGVKAYFSACLTLTLGRTYRVPESKRTDDIYFVDYRLGDCAQIDGALLPILRASRRRRRCFHRTHYYPLSRDVQSGLREAEALVREYARAGLVITRNIHCALPCLALGTPVIFVTPRFDKSRFQGLVEFFNHVGIDETGAFVCSIDADAHGHVRNPERHLPYAAHLEKLATAFGTDMRFAGVSPDGTPATVPRMRYAEAESETGLLRHVWQKKNGEDACTVVLFGRFRFVWSDEKRIVRAYRALKSLVGRMTR